MTRSARRDARSNGRGHRDPAQPVIAVSDGSVRYDDQLALRDVNLTVTTGEVVALLGHNGSGKSTLIRAILGLVPLSTGTLELFGEPAGLPSRRGRIGYVPQRHTVGGGIPSTVEEVVAAGRLGRRRFHPGLSRADREIILDAIEMVGLTGKLRENVATLSGGQQRRALIARALAGEPEVLVMDEPFAGVDASNQEILVHTLGHLIDRGLTLLLVTHELGPVDPLIRRSVLLRHGRVEADERRTPDSTAGTGAHPGAAEAQETSSQATDHQARDQSDHPAGHTTEHSTDQDADPHPVNHTDDTLGTELGLDGGTVS